MKVVIISHSAVVPLYRQKFHQLAKQGLDVHLILPPKWPEGNRWIDAPPSGVEKGVVIHNVNAGFLGHVGGYYFKGLGKVIKTINPDLIHVEEEPYSLVCWQIMKINKQTKRPWVFFSWENIFRHYRWPLSVNFRQVLTQCVWAIVGNQEGVTVLQQHGYQGQVNVIPQYGIDPNLFIKQSKDMHSDQSNIHVAYCGRLLEEKDIQTLIKALALIKTGWHLTIMGNGPYQQALTKLVNEMNIEKQVTFQGAVPNTAMPTAINQFDLLVLPSKTTKDWKEQFGRILIEAMACEIPVIGSSSGEIPHVIGDGGFIFSEGDHLDLKLKIEELIHDQKLRYEIGKKGRNRVLETYTTDQIVERTMLVYQNMLANQQS